MTFGGGGSAGGDGAGGGDGQPTLDSDGGEHDGSKPWHDQWNADPRTGGCPHCTKNTKPEMHDQQCPVRQQERHKRRGSGLAKLKALLRGSSSTKDPLKDIATEGGKAATKAAGKAAKKGGKLAGKAAKKGVTTGGKKAGAALRNLFNR